ncbi:hypothetical protein ACW73L_08295 [Methylolobus aquaticus]
MFDRVAGEDALRQLDARILRLSPHGDLFLLRRIAALPPIVFLAMDAIYGMPFFFWLGLPFYLACLALYAQALAKSLVLIFVTGSLDRMATALSVICPCAWALATPTVFASGIGRSARLNILARGGEPLSLMREISTVILDKTGTVTLGEPRVSEVIAIGLAEDELIEIAASVETRFSHPLARALLSFARERGITHFRPVSDAEDLPGRGVSA